MQDVRTRGLFRSKQASMMKNTNPQLMYLGALNSVDNE